MPGRSGASGARTVSLVNFGFLPGTGNVPDDVDLNRSALRTAYFLPFHPSPLLPVALQVKDHRRRAPALDRLDELRLREVEAGEVHVLKHFCDFPAPGLPSLDRPDVHLKRLGDRGDNAGLCLDHLPQDLILRSLPFLPRRLRHAPPASAHHHTPLRYVWKRYRETSAWTALPVRNPRAFRLSPAVNPSASPWSLSPA